ncbi:Sec-independent protein translocase subunit TatA/TatB [Magnetococcales bacterium HHB-1]
MFGLGTFEIIIILIIVLVIFGAGKLPKVMGDLGKGVKSFKREMDKIDHDIDKEDKKVVDGAVIEQKDKKTS